MNEKMRFLMTTVSILFTLAVAPSVLEAQLLETRSLGLEAAKRIVAGADAEARRNGWNVAISVVDPAGNQILFHRMDGVGPVPVEIALSKAKTAARFGRPTKELADALAAGNSAFLVLEGVMPLEGGIPVVVDGDVVGGVGVSGVMASQDAQIAQAGIDALLR